MEANSTLIGGRSVLVARGVWEYPNLWKEFCWAGVAALMLCVGLAQVVTI